MILDIMFKCLMLDKMKDIGKKSLRFLSAKQTGLVESKHLAISMVRIKSELGDKRIAC